VFLYTRLQDAWTALVTQFARLRDNLAG
jgi:hypothetical protein